MSRLFFYEKKKQTKKNKKQKKQKQKKMLSAADVTGALKISIPKYGMSMTQFSMQVIFLSLPIIWSQSWKATQDYQITGNLLIGNY